MKKGFLLLLACVMLNSCQTQQSSDEITDAFSNIKLPEKPNILWLVVEDMSAYIPDFGDSTIATPNISRLAKEGVCFDNFFASAPVCAPARAAIATGMYPTHIAAGHMRTGGNPEYFPEGVTPYEAMPPLGVKMMSEYLREDGYYCSNNSKEDYQFNKTATAWDESSFTAHWRNREEGQPFFSIFNIFVTHESRIWAKAEDSLWVAEDLDVPIPPYLPSTEVAKQDVRRMYSNIAEMDHQIGQILDELEEDGERENTIIFWYTDHGGPLPRQKRLLYDSGLKVPMIVRFPQKQMAGTRNDEMLAFIDLAPTTLSLAGIAPKDYYDGHDFIGNHRPEASSKYIFAAADRFDTYTDRNRAARDNRYKYIRYYSQDMPMFLQVNYRDEMGIMKELKRLKEIDSLDAVQSQWFRDAKPPFEFFDTWEDPHEINDLSGDPKYADKIEELSSAMDAWLENIDDTGLIPETQLLNNIWPEGKQPEVMKPVVELNEGKIALSSVTPGTSVGYKIYNQEDEEPISWKVYTSEISLPSDGQVLKVIGDRIGYLPSEVVVEEF